MMAVLVAFTPAVLHTDDTSGGVSIRFRFIAMVVHGLCKAVVNQVFPHVVRHQYRFLARALGVYVDLVGTVVGRRIQDAKSVPRFHRRFKSKYGGFTLWMQRASALCGLARGVKLPIPCMGHDIRSQRRMNTWCLGAVLKTWRRVAGTHWATPS